MPSNSWGNPPRLVPFSIKARLLVGHIATVFFTWFWLGISSVLFLSASFQSVLFHPSALSFSRNDYVDGVLQYIGSSNYSENEETVLAYSYSYTLAGKTYTGVSYDFKRDFHPGDTVRIAYRLSNPSESKITSMRVQPIPLWAVLFTFSFVFIGLLMALLRFKAGRRQIHLLRMGIATIGELVSEEEKNDKEDPYYEAVFEFTDSKNQVHWIVSSNSSQHEEREIVLYDSQNPALNELLSRFNCLIELDQGQVEPLTFLDFLPHLLIPSLVIVGNMIYLLITFTS